MFHRRSYLYGAIAAAVLGIWYLGPVTGATFNGQKSFLVTVVGFFHSDLGCQAAGFSSGSTACMDTYSQAGDLGAVICCLLGLVILVCIFQLVRLWVRRRFRS